MNIAIYGSRRQDPHAQQIQALLAALATNGAKLQLHPKLYHHLRDDLRLDLSGVRCADPDTAPAGADLVLSIGGDGTFLRTAAWVGALEIPIMGINTGTLGYLTALNIEEAIDEAETIVERHFMLDTRTLIRVIAPGVPAIGALNEVVISKDDYASIVTIEAEINGHELATYRADGLIVSTPTGSTAYNLSVGGPVVAPDAPVWVISPIAAHSLGMRPVVVSDSSTLRFNVTSRSKNFRLTVDGRPYFLPSGTHIEVSRALYEVDIVQWPGRAFPYALRNKLMFD